MESAHAAAVAIDWARRMSPEETLIVNMSGRGDKDLFISAAALDGAEWRQFLFEWIKDSRLDTVLEVAQTWVYVALRSGVTGTYTSLGEEQRIFLTRLKEKSARIAARSGRQAPRCMAGFGIQSYEQAREICQLADAAVVGSFVVKGVADTCEPGKVAQALIEKLRNG